MWDVADEIAELINRCAAVLRFADSTIIKRGLVDSERIRTSLKTDSVALLLLFPFLLCIGPALLHIAVYARSSSLSWHFALLTFDCRKQVLGFFSRSCTRMLMQTPRTGWLDQTGTQSFLGMIIEVVVGTCNATLTAITIILSTSASDVRHA